jgi:hypothetical protein
MDLQKLWSTPIFLIFLDNGLHNPASTSRDVHSQKVQTKAGSETQQTKVKTTPIFLMTM